MSDLIFDKNLDRYTELARKGMLTDALARVMIEDERADLQRRERDIDPHDRARLEDVARFGAKELGVDAPRLRFFESKGLTFRGITYGGHTGEVWIAADRPFYEQKEIALHELRHVGHFADGTPKDERERDAERFAARGRHW